MSPDTTTPTAYQTTHERISEQSLLFTREFDAPPELVFRAHVESELLSQWIGPHGAQMRVRAFDARTGGEWSYVIAGANGGEWAFFGSYHEVTAPTRIVHTWEFEAEAGHPTLETLTFVDLGNGRCRLEGISSFPSVEACARMAESDLLDGMDTDHERLDELLATLDQPVMHASD